ncbi:MAG: RDD family protein, partial [Acidobacteriaceae bacterium]
MSVIAPPSATGPLPETSLEPPVRHLGKLWKRCVAYLVDLFIISIPAYLIALPFSEFLCRSGPWGRLIGFCIAFPYYTLFNSDIGGGRTPGKRLLFLQLVDGQGQTIPLSSSALRYTLLFAPFFLNGLALPISHTPATLILAIEETTLILGFGTLYLVLFNQHT